MALQRKRLPMPADIKKEMNKRGLLAAYNDRPPYQQNDYLLWISEAKQDVTREKRIKQMLAELKAGNRYMKMPYPDTRRKSSDDGISPSTKITKYINSHKDWRGERLSALRELINEAAPDLKEEFKWKVPVWTSGGMVCAIAGFKEYVKLNIFEGASLPDPKQLFNSGLDSKKHRSINFYEQDKLDKAGLKSLIRAAADIK